MLKESDYTSLRDLTQANQSAKDKFIASCYGFFTCCFGKKNAVKAPNANAEPHIPPPPVVTEEYVYLRPGQTTSSE